MAVQEKEADLCTWVAGRWDFRVVRLGVLQLFFAGYYRIVSRVDSLCADYCSGSVVIAQVSVANHLFHSTDRGVSPVIFLYGGVWFGRKRCICGNGVFASAECIYSAHFSSQALGYCSLHKFCI
ncbi:hypothetical protein D3C73_907430 [compost metagenome]